MERFVYRSLWDIGSVIWLILLRLWLLVPVYKYLKAYAAYVCRTPFFLFMLWDGEIS